MTTTKFSVTCARPSARPRPQHPEIVKVLLFGSLVQGNWTADSDADLIVVVRREFPDFLSSRAPYQIFHPFNSHGFAGVFRTRV